MAHDRETISTWKNPTKDVVRFTIHLDGKVKRHYQISPGAAEKIDSIHDQAIRCVKKGVVVSGLAPQLLKEGEEEVPVHVALVEAAAEGNKERAARAAGRLAGKPVDEIVGAIRGVVERHPGAETALVKAQIEAEEQELAELRARKAAIAAEKAQLKAELEGGKSQIDQKLDAAGLGTPVKAGKAGKAAAEG